MRDRKNTRIENLLREIHDHHGLTTAWKEELDKVNKRGRIIYRHKCFINCPNHICINQTFGYSFMCFGRNCTYNHTRMYLELECGPVGGD